MKAFNLRMLRHSNSFKHTKIRWKSKSIVAMWKKQFPVPILSQKTAANWY